MPMPSLRKIAVVFIWLVVAAPDFAFAQNAGAIDYSTALNKLQYYSGSGWVDIGGLTTLGACSTKGAYQYDSGNSAWKYCNGTNWVSFAGQTTGFSCSTPGVLQYSAGDSSYKYCNGVNWVLARIPPPGYFVMSSGTYNGNRGGKSGADATCLTELTSNDWMGKTAASASGLLNSTYVKAFLCYDSSDCAALVPGFKYYFGRAGAPASGGSFFTTDSLGQGPGDAANWSGSTYFGVSATYWTGRGEDTATKWSTQGESSKTCTGFTSTSFWGAQGASAQTDENRWNKGGLPNCSGSYRLVCVVQPINYDSDPDAFSFTDLTNQSAVTVVTSNIVQITGISGASVPVALTNAGAAPQNPEFRICSDSSCSSVVVNWTSSPSGLSNGEYLQLRLKTSGNANTGMSAVVSVGSGSATWTATTSSGIDSTPNAFSIASLTNQPVSTLVTSAITAIGGISSGDIQINRGEYRVCANATCSSVLVNWTSVRTANTSMPYVQLRGTSAGLAGTQVDATFTIGSTSITWSIGTTANTNLGAFVISSTQYQGSALGGMSGANSICLTELTTHNFVGKLNVSGKLNATKVKAFLCDNTTCNNLTGSKTYVFADASSMNAGGSTFTTNASGQGPNDSNSWVSNTYFSGLPQYWTGRAAGTATLWPLTASGTSCSGWTASGSGTIGYVAWSDEMRWSYTSTSCTTSNYLICVVNP